MKFLKTLPSNEDESLNEINIAPLTDCMIVLLIIFMLAGSVFTQKGFNIDLPHAKNSVDLVRSEVSITVYADGRYAVNGEEVSKSDLFARLSKLENKDTPVSITADSKSSYGDVIYALDAAKQAGLPQAELAVDS